uniref:NADH dehydrogenase subunit 4L n=1 Tax=Aleurodicus rugioperculatus TaxID=1608326 RepID=UPI00286D3D40|nr:NADH dehydrogenase subunit 4L [Aleurodicus rugioperculatus]WKT15079.1 NADH dehydrogenase subunit 4L [Aleurodicus rugioperculatus]
MMKNMEINFTFFIFNVLMYYYIMNKNNMIKNLILIEFMILTIIIVMFMFLMNMKMQFFMIFLFMIISITESIIGISIIIAMIRTHNNEFIMSISIMKY